MLLRETIAVYCECHAVDINTLCGQSTEFVCVKAGDTYSDYWALNDIPIHSNLNMLV
jgi:hypothetical protein